MYIKTMPPKVRPFGRSKSQSSGEERHKIQSAVSRRGVNAVKDIPLSRDSELHNLSAYQGDYQDAFEEQLKASRLGKDYKLRPGLRDEEIWEAGIETPEKIKERKRLQKEASVKLKKERLARLESEEKTKKLIDSIHSMKTAKKGGQSRRTRRATQKKRIHKKH